MPPFTLSNLDHVAVRVKDLEISAQWYEQTLGLKRDGNSETGPLTMTISGKTIGVALFQACLTDPRMPKSKHVKIDHFAFSVNEVEFEKALNFFTTKKIEHKFRDHGYCHSIYLKDPDDHMVEIITTL